jgi:hypothetical protein
MSLLIQKVSDELRKKSPQHVDEFIDHGPRLWEQRFNPQLRYARFFLFYHRLNSVLKSEFQDFIADIELYATWQGERYRVTGASRMGDVWIRKNFKFDHGYDHRVMVEELSEFNSTPDIPEVWVPRMIEDKRDEVQPAANFLQWDPQKTRFWSTGPPKKKGSRIPYPHKPKRRKK